MSITIRDNIVRASVHSIFPNVWNPNEQTEFVHEKELHSIRTHGFLDPILVREIEGGFEIVDGEHRWKAAKTLGLTEIPVNNLGAVTDEVAKQLTIIMNETRGEARRDKLADLLKDLEASVGADELYLALPYQQSEIDALIHETAINWDEVTGPLAKSDTATASDAPKSDGPTPTVLPTGGEAPTQTVGPSSGGLDFSQEEGWGEIKYRLPEGVVEQFEEQVARFKKALHPDEDPQACSPVMAIEAMIQHLAQLPDDQLI